MDQQQFDLLIKLITEQGNKSDQRFEAMDKKIDQRFEAIDQRFEAIDQRFEAMDKKFDQQISSLKEAVVSRIDQIQYQQREDHKKLDEVYDKRNSVKITFGWQWGMASFVMVILGSAITRIFS